MSATPTVVSAELWDYVARHAPPEDDFLRELKAAAATEGIPTIWISPHQAAFLGVLLRAAGASQVVEVGTLAGVSAIAMARALPPGGRVRTVEISPKHAAFAREWTGRSDVADRVEIHEGDGRAILPRFPSASADAAFIDADKPGYATYVDECLRIVRPGGLLLVDNAFAFGRLLDPDEDDPSVVAIRQVNDALARDPRVEGVLVAVGDGLWVAVKR